MVTPNEPQLLELTVAEADAGLRVEQLVARALDVSRAEARNLCGAGWVLLDGRRVAKGARVVPGAVLRLELEHWFRNVPPEPEAPLDVQLERPDLVVVAKPAGIPTVPLAAGERGTLAGALVARYPEMQRVGYSAREPGVVHRLDTNTSGLVLAARSSARFKELVGVLQRGELRKKYLAVVAERGLSDSGVIDWALAPDPRRSGRVKVAERGEGYARPSTTLFRVRERGPLYALVELDASLAFRHQIRVHLATLGHPIVGDTLYAGPQDARLRVGHALHASYLAWTGGEGPAFEVEQAPPPAFITLVRDAPRD